MAWGDNWFRKHLVEERREKRMKLGKKLATLGLVGVMAIGQSVSAFASYEFKLNVGYGKPQVIGNEIYHSITVTLSYPQSTYLGAEMKVYYELKAGTGYSGYEIARNMDNTTKRTSIGAFYNWRDSGSALSRVYGKYEAFGYRTFGTNIAWDLVISKPGNVSEFGY